VEPKKLAPLDLAKPSVAKPGAASNIRGRKARQDLLAAATRLFAERGYAGVSIADIAAEARVAKPSVLYHFADKDSLWREAVDSLWAEVDAFYQENWPSEMTPGRPMLEAMLRLFIEGALRWPSYIRIPFIEGATPSWRSEWLADRHFGGHVRITDRILRACQHAGALPPGDIVHYQSILTSSINVAIAQAAMWSRAFDRDFTDRAFLDELVDLTLSLTFRSETVYKRPGSALA
jgi:TetR/AcrR family transcriptional regulator